MILLYALRFGGTLVCLGQTKDASEEKAQT